MFLTKITLQFFSSKKFQAGINGSHWWYRYNIMLLQKVMKIQRDCCTMAEWCCYQSEEMTSEKSLAMRVFGDGTMTTTPHCNSSKAIIIRKFHLIVWHLNKLLTEDQLETNQALTQQHLLTSAIKWQIVTFKADEVWEEGKGNKQIILYATAVRDLPKKQILHPS